MNNNEIMRRDKLSELVSNGYLSQDSFWNYYKRPNVSKLKALIKSQYKFSLQDAMKLKSGLFDSFNNTNTIWDETEIVFFSNILNNGGIITRKELLSKMNNREIDSAIYGLSEEGLIDSIILEQNEKLYFLNKVVFEELIAKYG